MNNITTRIRAFSPTAGSATAIGIIANAALPDRTLVREVTSEAQALSFFGEDTGSAFMMATVRSAFLNGAAKLYCIGVEESYYFDEAKIVATCTLLLSQPDIKYILSLYTMQSQYLPAMLNSLAEQGRYITAISETVSDPFDIAYYAESPRFISFLAYDITDYRIGILSAAVAGALVSSGKKDPIGLVLKGISMLSNLDEYSIELFTGNNTSFCETVNGIVRIAHMVTCRPVATDGELTKKSFYSLVTTDQILEGIRKNLSQAVSESTAPVWDPSTIKTLLLEDLYRLKRGGLISSFRINKLDYDPANAQKILIDLFINPAEPIRTIDISAYLDISNL